jgi:DNA-binding XRE family transcriptional regulator
VSDANGPNRLREYRLEAELAQDDLAQKVGVRSTTISRIERGVSQPSFPVAFALSRVLSSELDKVIAIEDLFPEPERAA